MEIDKKSTLIEKHKEMVFSSQPEINLVSPCRLNEGIIRHSDFEKNRFKIRFENGQQTIYFFIPASGTGSSMFKFLYEFLDRKSTRLNSSHVRISYAVFCLKKKNK